MALSNIKREPRREITEQVVGILTLCFVGWFIWSVPPKLFPVMNTLDAPDRVLAVFLSAFVTVFGIFLLVGLVYFMHFIGEVVCGLLADMGLEVRPKRRY